jgi:hypothetical protein
MRHDMMNSQKQAHEFTRFARKCLACSAVLCMLVGMGAMAMGGLGGCGPRKLKPRVPIAGFDAPEPVKAAFELHHPNASVRRVVVVEGPNGETRYAVDYTNLRQDKKRIIFDAQGNPIWRKN